MTDRLSIVHFSTADRSGGSARSAYRIHAAMRQRGHRSRMLVGWRVTDDADVDTVWSGNRRRVANRLADQVTSRLGLQYLYVPSTRRALAHPWLTEANIIQLYNTHGGYFATRMLPALSARAPLVWRLSDMWPMTGHCAYSGECDRWRTGCGRCPDLGTYPAIGLDTTARLWRMKDELYRASRITVVATSSWTERLARESPLLGRFAVHRIPNGIDLAKFRPKDRVQARASLGIDAGKRVILFSAHGLDANARKGSEDAVDALRALGPQPDTIVLLAGEGGASWKGSVPIPVVNLGFVQDEARLADVYASADILLAPSRAENLPNNVLESIACAVPVVAYDAGGMADAVRHMESGWLVPIGSVGEVAEGLRTLLRDDGLRRQLGRGGRALAEQQFSQEMEAQRFESLYRSLAGC